MSGMSLAIRLIVIHCSATPDERSLFVGQVGMAGFRDPAQVIDGWHAERGFMRSSYWRGRQNAGLAAIGYHYVIARNGALFTGRHVDEVGAHAQGWNAQSLGVCLVGSDRYTPVQWQMLAEHVEILARHHHVPLEPPTLRAEGKKGLVVKPGVCGHRDLPGHAKACPGFDVAAWLAHHRYPLAANIS